MRCLEFPFSFFLFSVLVCSVVTAQMPNVTINRPTIGTTNGQPSIRVTGTINVNSPNPLCVQYFGPVQPNAPSTINPVVAGTTFGSTFIDTSGQGFSNGMYKVIIGFCTSNGQIQTAGAEQRCFTVLNGAVKMVGAQMPVAPPTPRPEFVPTSVETLDALRNDGKIAFVSALDSSIAVEPTEAELICVARFVGEADAIELQNADAMNN